MYTSHEIPYSPRGGGGRERSMGAGTIDQDCRLNSCRNSLSFPVTKAPLSLHDTNIDNKTLTTKKE